MEQQPIVRMLDVSKYFPGVKALSNVSVDFYPGTVHVLIGENGAGKSTLIKMLSGVYAIDGGVMEYRQKPISFSSPKQALDMGISVIHQELSVVPDLTVAENIYLGREPKKGKFIDRNRMNAQTQEILNDLNVSIRANDKIRNLSSAQKQMVEIAKAISQNASVVIMDEPTSSISENEVQALFASIRKLKAGGAAIIYISHRLPELYEIGDTITVLRDGCLMATLPIGETDESRLISMMVGRSITNFFSKENHSLGKTVLEVKNLTAKEAYRDVSFSLYKGEILGISGLMGAGRTEVLRGIFGADRTISGEVLLHGKPVKFRSPQQAIACGVGLVPEDRRLQGILVEDTVRRNITLPSIKKRARNGFVDRKWEKDVAVEYCGSLRIKTPHIDTIGRNLSGGNQQKVVLAKWLVANSEILLLDEPTRGIDVNAKSEIYALINQYTQNGGSVVVVSSELPEIFGICDRILVMRNGRVAGMLGRDEATEEMVMRLASLDDPGGSGCNTR